MDNIKIYYLSGCPYCERVERKLEKLDIPYEKIEVPKDHEKRQHVKEVSGQTSVPVINDPNNQVEGMNESSDIVLYLEKEYGESDKDSEKDIFDLIFSYFR